MCRVLCGLVTNLLQDKNRCKKLLSQNVKEYLHYFPEQGWSTSKKLNQYDFLLFGPESVGLPDEIISSYKTITIPMKENSRSINLANSVGIVVFESLRQASVQ